MEPRPDASREWLPILTSVLEIAEADLAAQVDGASFVELGGTSLRAVEYAARLSRDCHRVVDVGALLGGSPLSAVAPGEAAAADDAATADEAAARPPRPPGGAGAPHDLTMGQEAMLLNEQLFGGTAFHLLFSADIHGPLDVARLRSAICWLVCRHPALRTVFVRDEEGRRRRRVLGSWAPVIIEQPLPPAAVNQPPAAADPPPGAVNLPSAAPGQAVAATDPVAAAQALIAPFTASLLRPYDQPPAVFFICRAGPGRTVLSLLAHHAVVDGWGAGLLWRELTAAYAAGPDAITDHPAGEATGGSLTALERTEAAERAARRRAEALAGWRVCVELPTDLRRPRDRSMAGARLVFGLSETARAGCAQLTRELGVTRNTILLAAWALVIGRRAAASRLLIGVASASRTTAESMQAVECGTKLLPVGCDLTDAATVEDYLRDTATALREALQCAEAPFEKVVAALGAGGDQSRHPLVQFAFGAHDELLPPCLPAGDVTFHLREGFCGGTAFEAVLYVQRWGESPTLALEFSTSALRGDEAAALASAIDVALVEFAANTGRPLAEVRTISHEQRRELVRCGLGPSTDSSADLWQLLEQAARANPSATALRDTDPTRTLTYQQLLSAVEAQAAAMDAAGVRPGDRVALAVRRSAREIVAILATLRQGAAYTGLEPSTPPALVAKMLDVAQIRVVLGDAGRLASLGSALDGRTALTIVRSHQHAAAVQPPPSATVDPSAAAYVAFTSGTTGTPKGTRVSRRAVVRLAQAPEYLRAGACDRFMRLAPLAFDASTLEIFAPLLNRGTIEVFPGNHVTADALAEFVAARDITGLWLTAGLFRLVADYQPGAFATVRQLLTGGDVVPAAHVARVLRACPGLRLTNGYGPTENTTFTTVHHIDDVAEVEDPVPIGRPIQGTGVLVLDGESRLVPAGGIGQLHTYGDGLADGYVGFPAETARAFGHFSPDSEHRLYRTGDVVRWDTTGRLRFLGRRDGQVKIRGFRVELDDVSRALREFPNVRDAVVVATPGSGDRRLVAGVAAPADPALPEALRAFATERLPSYAIPSLWAFVDELPVTVNGKVDAARLVDIAKASDPVRAAFVARRRARDAASRDSGAQPGAAQVRTAPNDAAKVGAAKVGAAKVGAAKVSAPKVSAPKVSAAQADAAARRDARGDGVTALDPVEAAVRHAWEEALGRGQFAPDERFFDVGGNSLDLLRVHASLQSRLPGADFSVRDLYRHQTVVTLAEYLRTRCGAQNGSS